MTTQWSIFLIVVAIVVLIRVIADPIDRERIRKYVSDAGGELLACRWSPFGVGWFGDKNTRIYEIRYRDSAGEIREATVKTAMFSGVFLSFDRVVSPAAAGSGSIVSGALVASRADLERENQALREQVAMLYERLGRQT